MAGKLNDLCTNFCPAIKSLNRCFLKRANAELALTPRIKRYL